MNSARLALALILVLPFAISACGGEEGASSAAGFIPADAAFYMEAVVNPEGESAEDLDAFIEAIGPLPGIESFEDLEEAIATQADSFLEAEGAGVSFTEDVEPWLGERLGVGYLFGEGELDPDDPNFVLALEVTDEEAARETLARALEADAVENAEAEYDGVSYYTTPQDGYAVGVFDDHLVLTTAADFETAVDTSRGEESLASSDGLSDTVGRLDEGSLASLYFATGRFAEVAAASGDESAADLEQAEELFPELFESGFGLAVGADAGGIALEAVSPLVDGQPELGGSPLLAAAPGDALAAFATSDAGELGPFAADLVDRAAESGVDTGDLPEGGLREAFEDAVGVPFDDAFAALGDAALWVRGEVPAGLESGEVEVGGEIEVSDEEIAEDLIDRLAEKAESKTQGARLEPPVGGSDVGFAIDGSSVKRPVKDDHDVPFEELDLDGGHSGDAELPYANVELQEGVVRYGFYRDREAAEAALTGEPAGEFGDTGAYSEAEESIGGDYELLGAADLGPIVQAALQSEGASSDLGTSPQAFIAEAIASRVGVIAAGIRYEDGYSFQRYLLGVGSGSDE